MITHNRSIRILLAASVAFGASVTALLAQETEPAERERRPRGGQWEEFRNLPPEERRARMEQWRNMSDEERAAMRERMRAERAERAEPPTPPTPELPPKPEKAIDQWLFRSVLTLEGRTQFSLHNPWENATFWIGEGDTRRGVKVVSHQADENTLTIRVEEEEKTLPLTTSRVAALPEEREDPRADRRAEWAERREQFNRFRAAWEEAAKTSPELREIESQFRQLAEEFRDLRQAARDLPEDAPERQQLRLQQREMFEEVRLLSEMATLQARQHPAFEDENIDNMERMIARGLMFQGDGSGQPGPRRGEGRQRGARGGNP